MPCVKSCESCYLPLTLLPNSQSSCLNGSSTGALRCCQSFILSTVLEKSDFLSFVTCLLDQLFFSISVSFSTLQINLQDEHTHTPQILVSGCIFKHEDILVLMLGRSALFHNNCFRDSRTCQNLSREKRKKNNEGASNQTQERN